MPNNVFLVLANFSVDQRAELLQRCPPRFVNVWCRHLVWAYKVPEDFAWPKERPLKLTITAEHQGEGHHALIGHIDIDGHTYDRQQLGEEPRKWLHITMSTDDGVPVMAAGEIDLHAVYGVEQFELDVTLTKDNARRLTAERRVA